MELASLDLNLLLPLAALLEERHVSRAADRTAMSQPAMSRALRKLRSSLGDELLVRGPHGYELTARAERIQRELGDIMPRLEGLMNDQVFEPGNRPYTFRLAGTDYGLSLLAASLLRRLRETSPLSMVRFVGWHQAAYDDATHGTLDLVLTGGAAPPPLRSETIFTDHYVCLLSEAHPLAHGGDLTLDEYLACDHVVVDILDGRQGAVDQRLDAVGRPRRPIVTIPYHHITAKIVRETQMVVTLPSRLAVELQDGQPIIIVGAPSEITPMSFSMGWHPRLDEDPAQRWLRDIVRAVAFGL